MAGDLDEFNDNELDKLELKKIRRMLKENEQAHYLWSFAIKVVVGAGALAGAAAAIKGWLLNYVTFK